MWKLFREAGPFGLSPLGYLFGISEPISPTAEIRRAVFRHSSLLFFFESRFDIRINSSEAANKRSSGNIFCVISTSLGKKASRQSLIAHSHGACG